MAEPMPLGGSNVTTSASIGITTSEFGYAVPDHVMGDADIALYRAKAQGKARYAMFNNELHVEASKQMRLEVDRASVAALRLSDQPLAAPTAGRQTHWRPSSDVGLRPVPVAGHGPLSGFSSSRSIA